MTMRDLDEPRGARSYELWICDRQAAEYLMMAPAVAGGWVLVHPDCREAVRDILGEAYFLALLPRAWQWCRGGRVSRATAEAIACAIERRAQPGMSVVLEDGAVLECAGWIRSAVLAGAAA